MAPRGALHCRFRTMSDRVRITTERPLAYVTLARPEKHNGVDFEMLRAVVAAQASLRKRRDLRSVVLRGEGPSFCAGLDFKSVREKPLQAARMVAELWTLRRNV